MRQVRTVALLLVMLVVGAFAKAHAGAPRMLAEHLLTALMRQDYAAVGNLIDDNAILRNVDSGCAWMNKKQFVEMVSSSGNGDYVASITEGVESNGAGLFRQQSAAIGQANSTWAASPWYDDHAFVYVAPNADGSKIMVLDRITDQSWRQNNASAMINVFNNFAGAYSNQSATEMAALLTSDFVAVEMQPGFERNASVQDKTEYIGNLTESFKERSLTNFQTTSAFAACDWVAASGYDFIGFKKGERFANKFIVASRITSDLKQIKELMTWALFPFDHKKHQ